MKNKMIKVFSACIVLMLLQGCATSHEKASIQNLAPDDFSINRLVVVGIINQDASRAKFENGFADKMEELGVACDTSHEAIPNIDDLDDEAKYNKAKSTTTANASVVLEIIDVNEGAIDAKNALFGVWIAGVLLGDDTLRSAGAWGGLAAGGAAGNLKMRVTLWDMEDDSLLWSMDTDSYNYALANTNKSGAIMADLVYRELKEDGLIN